MMMSRRLCFCLSWWVLEWIFISDRLGLLLMNSGVLLILFMVWVSWV